MKLLGGGHVLCVFSQCEEECVVEFGNMNVSFDNSYMNVICDTNLHLVLRF